MRHEEPSAFPDEQREVILFFALFQSKALKSGILPRIIVSSG